jgi:hypothetical protein
MKVTSIPTVATLVAAMLAMASLPVRAQGHVRRGTASPSPPPPHPLGDDDHGMPAAPVEPTYSNFVNATNVPTSAPTSAAPPAAANTWADGTACVVGATCDRCKNPATYWNGLQATACGAEPCWPYGTRCWAVTTCQQCCHGYSWKWTGMFTSCN